MVASRGDRLEKLIGSHNENIRIQSWLWHLLHSSIDYSGYIPHIPSFQVRNRMALIIDQNPTLQGLVREQLGNLVPAGDLSWIKRDNDRQTEWLINAFTRGVQHNINAYELHASGREKLILLVDLWETPRNLKLDYIKNLKQNWKLQETLDKELSWFEDENKNTALKKLEFAWEYFKKNRNVETFRTPLFQTQNELLSFIDKLEPSNEEKELFLIKTKKKWTQLKSRNKETSKTQTNILLSKRTKENLAELREKHELSATKVIELLINQEAEHSLYLPKIMSAIKKLDEL